eukprot:GHVU01137692.1.p1 GENE.GHVU01137692.1~~GHVU01137692.1.p1  ORF type:complete len:120 (+),score=10.30 GHVU01137692.1:50-409(+)
MPSRSVSDIDYKKWEDYCSGLTAEERKAKEQKERAEAEGRAALACARDHSKVSKLRDAAYSIQSPSEFTIVRFLCIYPYGAPYLLLLLSCIFFSCSASGGPPLRLYCPLPAYFYALLLQ